MRRFNLNTQHYPFIFYMLILLSYVSGCTGEAENEIPSSRLIITLVDSPADYHELNVDIREISIQMDAITENDGWIKLDKFTPGIYNILEFTGGQELPLADMQVPPGNIVQFKLKLGNKNTLVLGTHTSSLSLANNTVEGYTFSVNEAIPAGETMYYRIDFDAAQSIIQLSSSGQMVLKPVLKLLSDYKTGSISGEINPAEKNVLVNVISSNKVIASTYAPLNSSKFFLPGIESGIYDISFESSDDSYQKYIRNVNVTTGQNTDMGNFSMESGD